MQALLAISGLGATLPRCDVFFDPEQGHTQEGPAMSTQAEKADRFRELHQPGTPLLMPNPWDVGSAKLLESIGFQALATTSSGFAATLGRLDGRVTRDEALEHAAELAAAIEVPLSGDLENCFADDPAGVADTVRLAIDAGLAGCSVEDYSGRDSDSIYPLELAVDRVKAAVEAAHAGSVEFVITARAENLIHGVDDLDDTIARLQAFAEAGADVLFAPGVASADDIRRVVESVAPRPVSVLALPHAPSVPELAKLGVARVSVGGAFAFAAIGAAVEAGRELLEQGTYGYFERTATGGKAARAAFG
jgi:2-methylisocitrate lyase-like PEP mutase family enzyme